MTRLPDIFRLFALALVALSLPAASLSAELRPLDMRVVQSGHSLTDPIPRFLLAMVQAAGGRGAVIERSTIPGSPMDWRWNNRAPGVDARHDIADFDLLVLTERVPLADTMEYHDSPGWALRWAEHAWADGRGGAGAEVVLYATWIGRDTGPGASAEARRHPEGHLPFRARLQIEADRWDAIRDHVNAHRPAGSPEVPMIPGPALMTALYDAVAAGAVPGVSAFADFFSDDIHLSDLGSYVVALAHYAVIYGRDPRDLPAGLGRLPLPDVDLARWLQALVHDVVWRDPRTGIGGAPG